MAKKRSPKVNIRIAKEEDIPAILAIQRALLLGNKKGRFIQKRGFLVYPINEEDLKRVTHSNQNVLLVAEGEMGIVGYALAYDLSEWERTKPNWNGNVTTTTPQNNNFGPKTLYFRHIARKPGYKGIGEELEKEVFGIAESKGYNSVLGEILE